MGGPRCQMDTTIDSSYVCMLQMGEAKCVRTALYRVAVIFFIEGFPELALFPVVYHHRPTNKGRQLLRLSADKRVECIPD